MLMVIYENLEGNEDLAHPLIKMKALLGITCASWLPKQD